MTVKERDSGVRKRVLGEKENEKLEITENKKFKKSDPDKEK